MEVKLHDHIRYADVDPVTEIIHSCQDLRVIVINLQSGQSIAPNTSSSSVSLQVIAGRGELLSGSDWVPVGPGTIRFYPPGEAHGIRAPEEPFSVLVILAPRP